MTTILIKKKDTAGAPAAGDLTNAAGGAEIAVNTATKRIYSKDSGGTVIEMGTFPSTMAVQGALSATGNVTLGDASADSVTVNGTITSNLIFTDATYDIGASGATRPRDLFLSRNLTVGGTLTLAGGVNLNGNVTVGDSSADTLTINSTITSNLIFTDNTYDIGASGATRPRTGYFGTSLITPLIDATNVEVTNIKALDGTAAITIANSTGAVAVSTNVTLGDATTDTVKVNGYMGIGGSTPLSYVALYVTNSALTGSGQNGVYSAPTANSTATSSINAFVGDARTDATAFTVTNARQFFAANFTKGAGSTITNAIGYYVEDMTTGTNNYGIQAAVSSGTNKFNIYASGTAQNYFAGPVGVGTVTTSLGSINLAGSAALGITSGTTGDYLSSGGGNNSTYNGLAILSNSRAIATQANTSLPSWIVDIGGRAADGSTYNPNTANKFRVAYVAAGGSYYTATNFFAITSAGNVGINNISPTVRFEANGDENEALTMTSLAGAQGAIGYNQGEIRECGFNVNNASNTVISDIVTTSTGWRVVFRGTWSNNFEGSGLSFYAPYIELNAANPSTPIGSRTLTVSRNGSGFLIVNSSDANRISFAGTVEVYENPQSLQPVQSMRLLGGIQFPATQNATSQANTLDDYEEGTWTPEIQIGGSSTGITYSSRGGYYRKIGSTVFCTAQIQLSSKGSNTGDLTLNGFPFTTDGATASRGGGSFNYFHSTPALTNAGSLFLLVESSDTRSVLRYYNTSTGLSVALSQANVNNTTEFFFTFTYIAAS